MKKHGVPERIHTGVASNDRHSLAHPDEIRYEAPFGGDDEAFLYLTKFSYAERRKPEPYPDGFECCYVCSGSGWMMVEDVIYHVKQGNILIAKPNEVRARKVVGNANFKACAVGFRFAHIEPLEEGYRRIGPACMTNDPDGIVKPYMDRIFAEIEAPDAFAPVRARGELMAMLTVMLRLYQSQYEQYEPSPQTGNPFTAEILQVLHLIHQPENYSGRAEDLAKAVNMSRVHLDREFKRQLGQSLGEYTRGILLDRSKRILSQSNDTVTKIASDLKFDSVQTFCRFFKRMTGLTPQAYKKRCLQ